MSGNVPVLLSRRAFLLRSEMPTPSVSLSDHCFALNGVYCESCRDVCESGAIRFIPRFGAVPKPMFDADLCTQCGECAQVCPRNAIEVRQMEQASG